MQFEKQRNNKITSQGKEGLFSVLASLCATITVNDSNCTHWSFLMLLSITAENSGAVEFS